MQPCTRLCVLSNHNSKDAAGEEISTRDSSTKPVYSFHYESPADVSGHVTLYEYEAVRSDALLVLDELPPNEGLVAWECEPVEVSEPAAAAATSGRDTQDALEEAFEEAGAVPNHQWNHSESLPMAGGAAARASTFRVRLQLRSASCAAEEPGRGTALTASTTSGSDLGNASVPRGPLLINGTVLSLGPDHTCGGQPVDLLRVVGAPALDACRVDDALPAGASGVANEIGVRSLELIATRAALGEAFDDVRLHYYSGARARMHDTDAHLLTKGNYSRLPSVSTSNREAGIAADSAIGSASGDQYTEPSSPEHNNVEIAVSNVKGGVSAERHDEGGAGSQGGGARALSGVGWSLSRNTLIGKSNAYDIAPGDEMTIRWTSMCTSRTEIKLYEDDGAGVFDDECLTISSMRSRSSLEYVWTVPDDIWSRVKDCSGGFWELGPSCACHIRTQ